MSDHLIAPYGGDLVDLLVSDARSLELKGASRDWPSWDLTSRQTCDLELLVNGAFSPLRGFLGQEDYTSVCKDMRLADGTLWPVPITLDVSEDTAEGLTVGSALALRDGEGVMLAVLRVSELWKPDLEEEASRVFGTTNPTHPGVAYLLRESHPVYLGGEIEGLAPASHYDFSELRIPPRELRAQFARRGWREVVAYQTLNVMHRAEYELTLWGANQANANLLIHPLVGMSQPGDARHFTKVRCYQALMPRYPHLTAKLALANLAPRMAGPRETVWRGIVARNHGCNHILVGPDHAGPDTESGGDPFYGPNEARRLMQELEGELGVKAVPFYPMAYVDERDRYMPVDEISENLTTRSISRAELRDRLENAREVPEWFTFPEVAAELKRSHPPRTRQGFTVFFTGLSGSGKSTVANVLCIKLLELGGRTVTLLDGDIVRKNLSSELGFSKEHRNLNIHRIGFVASEITKGGGVAVCAPIAPYDSVRKHNRELITPHGGYVLVHLSTPLEVCEERDRKGLYAKARAGIIKEFTGISDPYEAPDDADVVIDTSDITPEEATQRILLHLEKNGYIGGRET